MAQTTSPKRKLTLTAAEASDLHRLLGLVLRGSVNLRAHHLVPTRIERAFDKVAAARGAPPWKAVKPNRKGPPGPWSPYYKPKKGDPFWAVFDGDNGDPRTHLYVWWFPTRATAQEFFRHMSEVYPDRRVSKPFRCKVLEDGPP